MFESLDKQIADDEKRTMTTTERIWLWSFIAVLSILAFGGLYYALRLLA